MHDFYLTNVYYPIFKYYMKYKISRDKEFKDIVSWEEKLKTYYH